MRPAGVILRGPGTWLDRKLLRSLPVAEYKLKTWYYRHEPLAFMESEELLARRNGVPVLRTATMKSPQFQDWLRDIGPDLLVLGGGWPELIPEGVLAIPRLGCVNTHPSLLPKYRGTSITRWQVLHGVGESGMTIHLMEPTFDTGDIVAQRSLRVSIDETPQLLFQRLAELGAEMMLELLRDIQKDGPATLVGEAQDVEAGDYYSQWSWDLKRLQIDWRHSLEDIHNFIRANTQESYEYPGPIFQIGPEEFIARKSRLLSAGPNEMSPGADQCSQIVDSREAGWVIGKPSDPHLLLLEKVQRLPQWKLRRSANPASAFPNIGRKHAVLS